jgi:type I restriction enzyme, S subunit
MSKIKKMPEGWSLPELEEVLDIQGGSQPPKSTFIYQPKEGYIQLLQIRDFGKKPVPTFVPVKKVSKFCKNEDVLIARYGASLGRIVTGLEGAYNVALAKVIDKYGIFNNRYLFYLLQTQIFQMPLAMLSRSAQNGFAKHEISHIRLPIPPLPEQHRIVAKIDELFSSLDKGIESLKTAQAQLKTYRQAVLKWAFEGKLTNENVKEGELPEGWKWVKVEEVSEKIQIGPFGSQLHKEDYIENGIPLINPMHIQVGKIVPDPSYSVLREKKDSLPNYILKIGDVILGRRGEMGRCGLVQQRENGWLCGTGSLFIRPLKKKIDSKFLHMLLGSPPIKKYLERNAAGTTMSNLNSTIIKQIPALIPPLAEQHSIVTEIETRLSVCDKLEENIAQSLLQAEALRQSILKKAFEGKLVPQDPNDEPASVLLEQIRVERESTVAKKTTVQTKVKRKGKKNKYE